MRVKTGIVRHKKHLKIRQAAKGFRGARGRRIKQAKEGLLHAKAYAYRDRRNKKRDFKRLWIIRLNAAARNHGLKYSEFIHSIKDKGIMLDRKILAQIALDQPAIFDRIIKQIKR